MKRIYKEKEKEWNKLPWVPSSWSQFNRRSQAGRGMVQKKILSDDWKQFSCNIHAENGMDQVEANAFFK